MLYAWGDEPVHQCMSRAPYVCKFSKKQSKVQWLESRGQNFGGYIGSTFCTRNGWEGNDGVVTCSL